MLQLEGHRAICSNVQWLHHRWWCFLASCALRSWFSNDGLDKPSSEMGPWTQTRAPCLAEVKHNKSPDHANTRTLVGPSGIPISFIDNRIRETPCWRSRYPQSCLPMWEPLSSWASSAPLQARGSQFSKLFLQNTVPPQWIPLVHSLLKWLSSFSQELHWETIISLQKN